MCEFVYLDYKVKNIPTNQCRQNNVKGIHNLVSRIYVKRYNSHLARVMELKILKWPQDGSIGH